MLQIRLNKINRLFLSSLLIISLFLSTISCSSKKKADNFTRDQIRDVNVYSSQAIDIFEKDTYSYIYNVIPYNNYYYSVVQQFAIDLSYVKNYLYCIDSNGEIVSTISLSDDINIYGSSDIIDGEFVYTTLSNSVEKLNISTGEIVYISSTSLKLCGVSACEDGYVLLSVGRVDKFDSNDQMVATIENSRWDLYNGYRNFYTSEGKSYLLNYSGGIYRYYELNFDDSSSKLIYDTEQHEGGIQCCSGEFIFDDNGEYRMDFVNSTMTTLAEWNFTNLQPPQYTNEEPRFFGVDDTTFLQTYNYQNGIAQLVIYTYEETEDYSDKTYITLGGYECSDDFTLNWAVYKFNTSQDEYRIIMEDYSKAFGFETLEEAAIQKAALIQYFNEGNAPDIYYGTYFDYSYMAKSGDIIDMTKYMSDDFKSAMDELTPSIHDLMVDSEGKCYSVFSAYYAEGFASGFDIDSNLSIDEVIELVNEYGITMLAGRTSADLATNAIQYSIFDGEMFTVEELEQILNFAYEYGFQDLSYVSIPSLDRTTVDEYLLWSYGITNGFTAAEDEYRCGKNLSYVGYPTINGSKHVVVPFGQVAISSASKYPEQCTQFISYLLDGDVQDMVNLSCRAPVNDKYLRKFVEYSKDTSTIPEEDYGYYVYLYGYRAVSDETADCFYRYIDTLDTVVYHDWGVVNIIYEEVNTYYTLNKPVNEIAESLHSKLELYLAENN